MFKDESLLALHNMPFNPIARKTRSGLMAALASERRTMSCIIRISGESLDVDALLAQSTLQTDRAWRKGEPGRLGKLHPDSGANFVASDADIDQLQHQITEAEIFLTQHIAEIGLIVAFPGVTHAVIDFGVAFEQESTAVFCHLPANVVQLVARSRLAVEFSVYACSAEDED